MRGFLRLVILLGIFIAAPAWAQGSTRQRKACTDDAYRFCQAQVPVAEDVSACLRAHMDELSPACRRELMGGKSRRRGRRR
jgi:hypothetical protein